jgi:hypothetical protein
MAKFTLNKGGGGIMGSKKFRNFMIMFIGVIMVLSALEVFLNRAQNVESPEDESLKWNTVKYESVQLGQSSALTQIVAATDQYKLRPNQPNRLDSQDVSGVFESNISGVSSIVLESGPDDMMFNIRTDGRNVSDEVKKRIRLPGGYLLFRVYMGSTPYGGINVAGEDLKVGDYVRVLLMQRTSGAKSDVIGFAQKKVAVGPLVNATVSALEAYAIEGVSYGNVTAAELSSALNATGVNVTADDSLGAGARAVYLKVPMPSDIVHVRDVLAGFGVSNVSASVMGYSKVPDEMIVGGEDFMIPDSARMPTILNQDARVNDTVRVYVAFGNESASAIEISATGTGAL